MTPSTTHTDEIKGQCLIGFVRIGPTCNLPHGARKVLLRDIEEAFVRKHFVPARDLGNEGPRRNLVKPKLTVHECKITARDASAREASFRKT